MRKSSLRKAGAFILVFVLLATTHIGYVQADEETGAAVENTSADTDLNDGGTANQADQPAEAKSAQETANLPGEPEPAQEKAGQPDKLREANPGSGTLAMETPLLAQAASGQDASAYFHATITSSKDTYASGTTALYSVKYTIDRGSIHEGDYIYVTVPTDIISSVDLSVASQHFSGVENQGNGTYKLTFAEGAESALSGSFSTRPTRYF